MSIEQTRTVEVLSVEVLDDYTIGIKVEDLQTHTVATVALSAEEAQQHVDEVLARISEATSKFWEDREAQGALMITHRFDLPRRTDRVVLCPACRAEKCNTCDGRAVDEWDRIVQCGCSHSKVVAS
jgi:polyhydroxyalkanoate synthesis regulator phasin